MVLELCLGGELFAYLARQPRHCVPPNDAQFYCACVVSAIDHMHSKDICYRDMKPENMLIDDQGYVKVCRRAGGGRGAGGSLGQRRVPCHSLTSLTHDARWPLTHVTAD